MDALQSAFSRVSLSERTISPHTRYQGFDMLRERYRPTLMAFYTAKCTFDEDNLTLIMNQPEIEGFVPPTHLIIVHDPKDESETSYFPTHQDLWAVASGYLLPRRDPALPWNRLVPAHLTGNTHGPMAVLHTLLYGIVLPPEEIRACADGARRLAVHFRMPYIVANIDGLKNNTLWEEDEMDSEEEE